MALAVSQAFESLREAVSRSSSGGITSPEGDRHVSRTERSVAAYFVALRDRLPYGQLATFSQSLLDTYGEDLPEHLVRRIEIGITPMMERPLKGSYPIFVRLVSPSLAGGFVYGQDEVEGYMGAPIAESQRQTILMESAPDPEIVSWAEAHAATLVTQMDKETIHRLALIIADAIENQVAGVKLIPRLKREFPTLSRHRARVIALTETSDAYAQGAFDKATELKSTHKRAWTSGAADHKEDICDTNQAQGRIPITQPFASGHSRNPFHPKCYCRTVYFGAGT